MNNELTIVIRARDLATKTVRTLGKEIVRFSRFTIGALRGIGAQLTRLRTLLLAAFAGDTIRQFANFERGVISIKSLLSDTAVTAEQISRVIKDVAVTTGQDFAEALNSGFNAVSAFGEGGLKLLPQAGKLAVAGLTDIDTAVKGLTSVLNNYNLTADDATRVSDLLFNIQAKGTTDVAQVAEDFQKVLPTAKTLGLELEDVGAAFAALTQSFTTPEAATALKAILRVFTDQNAIRAAKELGFELSASAIEAAGGIDLYLKKIKELNLSPIDLKKVFNSDEAFSAINPLLNSVERVEGALDTIRKGAGATEKAFKEASETLFEQFKRLRSAFQELQIEIGEGLRPVTERFIGKLRELIDFIKRNRNVVVAFAELVIETLGVAFETAGRKALEFVDFLIAAFQNNQTFAVIANFAQTAVTILARVFVAGIPVLVQAAIQLGRGFGIALAESLLKSFGDNIATQIADSPILAGFLKTLGVEGIDELQTKLDGISFAKVRERAESLEGLTGLRELGNSQIKGIARTYDALAESISAALSKVPESATETRAALQRELDAIQRSAARAREIRSALLLGGGDRGADTDEIQATIRRRVRGVRALREEFSEAVTFALGGLSDTSILQKAQADAGSRFAGLISKLATETGSILSQEFGAAIERADPSIREKLRKLFDFSGLDAGVARIREAFNKFTAAIAESGDRAQVLEFLKKYETQFVALGNVMLSFVPTAKAAGAALKGLAGGGKEDPKKGIEDTTAALQTWAETVEQVGPQLSSGLANLFGSIIDGSRGAKEAILDFVSSAISSLSRLFLNFAFQRILGSAFPDIFPQGGAATPSVPAGNTAAYGAVFRGGFQAFANGSPRVSKATLGLVGEGRRPEAIVPLPDGTRIPVQLQGNTGGSVVVNNTFNIQSLEPATAAAIIYQQADTIKQVFTRAIQTDPSFRQSARGGGTV